MLSLVLVCLIFHILCVIFVMFAMLVIIIIIVEGGLLGGFSYTLPAYCWGPAGDCWGLLENCWWTAGELLVDCLLFVRHAYTVLAMTESPQLSIHETMHERPRSSTPEPRQMGVSAQGRLYPMRLAQG